MPTVDLLLRSMIERMTLSRAPAVQESAAPLPGLSSSRSTSVRAVPALLTAALLRRGPASRPGPTTTRRIPSLSTRGG